VSGGLYDGLQSSITDLGSDYDNVAIADALGGSAGGLMHKACMAALGFGPDVNMNSLLDAAYQTEINSNVIPLAPRKNFLYPNPTTGRPMFEYRGAFMITAGCEIQSYSIDAVCITEKELKLNKGAVCQS
jgi:hypothetical protein